MKIKICGLTHATDIALINTYPVWAVGFNFYAQSPRCVSIAHTKTLGNKLAPGILKVAVFVNASINEIKQAHEACHFDLIQLHGDEDPAFCQRLGLPIIKALRVRNADSLAVAAEYEAHVDYLLCDAYQAARYGGTGTHIDPDTLKHFAPKRPWILAGGIGPDNAASA